MLFSSYSKNTTPSLYIHTQHGEEKVTIKTQKKITAKEVTENRETLCLNSWLVTQQVKRNITFYLPHEAET